MFAVRYADGRSAYIRVDPKVAEHGTRRCSGSRRRGRLPARYRTAPTKAAALLSATDGSRPVRDLAPLCAPWASRIGPEQTEQLCLRELDENAVRLRVKNLETGSDNFGQVDADLKRLAANQHNLLDTVHGTPPSPNKPISSAKSVEKRPALRSKCSVAPSNAPHAP